MGGPARAVGWQMGEKISSFSQPVGTLPRAAQAMGRSGDGPKRECPVSPRYHSLPTTRAVGTARFRVSDRTRTFGCGFLRPAPHTWVPTYLPTPAK